MNAVKVTPVKFPYHPSYGLPDDVRAQILVDAERLSVREAAELHNVSVSVIYLWRKALKEV